MLPTARLALAEALKNAEREYRAAQAAMLSCEPGAQVRHAKANARFDAHGTSALQQVNADAWVGPAAGLHAELRRRQMRGYIKRLPDWLSEHVRELLALFQFPPADLELPVHQAPVRRGESVAYQTRAISRCAPPPT